MLTTQASLGDTEMRSEQLTSQKSEIQMLKDKFYGKNSSKEFEMSEEGMTEEDLMYIKKMHNEIMLMNAENGQEEDDERHLAISSPSQDSISSLFKNLDPE